MTDTCVAAHNCCRDMTGQEISSMQGEQWQWEFALNPADGKTYLMMGWLGSGQSYHFRPE